MAALPGVIPGVVAHGGLAGAIAEAFVAVAVIGVFAVIWLRERSARKEEARGVLRDPDDQTS